MVYFGTGRPSLARNCSFGMLFTRSSFLDGLCDMAWLPYSRHAVIAMNFRDM